MVGAGLQGHIGGGAAHLVAPGGGVSQGHHFRVGLARRLGVAFAQQLAVLRGDDAAHPRVRLGQADRRFRQGLSARHEDGILRGEHEGRRLGHGAGSGGAIIWLWGFSPKGGPTEEE
jgi:hypothetical protein